jgi:cysteinyl-tRNA synthetase
MTISIYNTLSRSVVPLTPLEPGHVRMYVCGMTTYDLCHLGHGRTFAAFDVVVRWLRARGLRVTYVRNITDIEDKIIKRAAEYGEPPGELTTRYIDAMHEDFAALGLQPPDLEPRATDFVPQMLNVIELLEQKNLAYAVADGDVNYAVRGFAGYGKLSGKSLDDLRAGERVAIDQAKRDPLDFVLWKHAKPGEPQWPSRWGPGRPGWHIECSAMARASLGATLDIHGGGPDLIFPHHENEIAQSEGAYGQTFANVWLHTGALRVGEDKMSKSLGNFLTIRAALAKYDAEVLRFFLIRSHYRSQIAFTEHLIVEARAALARLYTALRDTPAAADAVDWNELHAQRFASAMDEDFNTALAVSVLFELASEINRGKSPVLAQQLKGLGGVLGLLQRDPQAFLQGEGDGDVQSLIDQRSAAKKARNFAEADRIRKDLLAQGIVLEDSASGTTWRRQ